MDRILQDEITSYANDSKISANAKVLINGTTNIDHAQGKAKAAPWLEELKINQVKKSASQGNSHCDRKNFFDRYTGELCSGVLFFTVNVKSGFTSSGSNVTFRFQRPVSMFSGEAESHSLTFGAKPTPLVSEQNSSTNEIVTSPVKTVAVSANAWKSLNEKVTRWWPTSPEYVISTIRVNIVRIVREYYSCRQVNNMEVRMEMQNEYFKKTIEQLKLTLVKEIELRLEMKKEMDKLMDLVTQV